MFDKRRPHAVGRLIHNLLRPQPSLPKPVIELNQPATDGERALTILARAASQFCFAALGTMFAINHEIAVEEFIYDEYIGWIVPQIGETALTAFLIFIGAPY